MVIMLSEDYVLLVWVKGLFGWMVMFWYVVCNVLFLSVINFVLVIGGLVGGLLLIEIVFFYFGMGFLFFDVVLNCDYLIM